MTPEYGYIGMTADILHIGHIRFIKKCAGMCKKLIVGVMTDECVEEYKGYKPIMSYAERAEIIESINGVNWVIPQDTFQYGHNIQTMQRFWRGDFIVFDSEEHKRNGADIIVTRTEGISSTDIKRRIYENFVYRKR